VTTAHVPVMAQEAVAALAIKPDGLYVDGTFGRGGHSRLILAELGSAGRLIALDRDPDAMRAGAALNDVRLSLVQRRFSELEEVLAELGVAEVDGVLLDIGVSSPQLDDAMRGFSFRFDAPLDMRMDPGSGLSAAQWLATASEEEISEVIQEYGEERFAKSIARTLVAARQQAPIERTTQLAQIIAHAVGWREAGQHPATRSFQAIRIYLNRELEELTAVLPQCVDRLKPGGRLAVISFHSLEDRIVKRFMRAESQGEKLPDRLPVRAATLKPGRLRLVGRAQHATEAEITANPRARSAVLRVAERMGHSPVAERAR
jgi:16S rRNA (cytosine1402-N4)-methyltransferase